MRQRLAMHVFRHRQGGLEILRQLSGTGQVTSLRPDLPASRRARGQAPLPSRARPEETAITI